MSRLTHAERDALVLVRETRQLSLFGMRIELRDVIDRLERKGLVMFVDEPLHARCVVLTRAGKVESRHPRSTWKGK